MRRHQFRVMQSSTRCDGDLWDWSLWIEPDRPAADYTRIVAVTYGLHPAYPSPNRVIRNPGNRFRLDISSRVAPDQTWGRFDVRVSIALAGGEREQHTVALALVRSDAAHSPAPELLPLPADADYAQAVRYFGLLMKKSAFGYAREVLDHAEKALSEDKSQLPAQIEERRLWIAQQRALCTYKDTSLPTDTRLRDALAILETRCGLDLSTCNDPETLGLGGAIYKRLWDADRSIKDLERSLAYYRRGYGLMLARKSDPNSVEEKTYDAGAFTGANVIYLCEVLALEIPADVDATRRGALLKEADTVRRRLVADLPELRKKRPRDWWIAGTLLDAYFGLACREPANFRPSALEQAQLVAAIEANPWEQQSTGAQLLRSARLQARLHAEEAGEIGRLLTDVVDAAFGGKINTRDAWFDGKLGLALSGGGFRASLFHIGVLARMAELDLLRHVEVISCVSGGSIVGAHYYLLLRKLLQTVADGDVRQAHYIELVNCLLQQFLAGVQKNIRMRVAASWLANLRMIFQPNAYSRTQRLGQLYEKYLYRQVKDGEGDSARWLNEVFIVPMGKDGRYEDGFSPKLDNWRRGAKVPMLVLNATTLNTGRNWQFTASFMGEPLSYGTGVDATERLEAVYFNEAPEKWQRYRLGEAVSASSCVPALFTPIVIADLFAGRTVRLVDGGVHDNQGARALLDQDCDALIVSDASGQMESVPNPSHAELGVMLRTNSVLQARIRIAQHQELQARERSHLLRGCVFLHLRKGVESTVQKALMQVSGVAGTPASDPAGTTEYSVDCRVQRALSSLRTDLDSFNDREALSLMCSGYQMADKYLGPLAAGRSAVKVPWAFESVASAVAGKDQAEMTVESLLRYLRTGAHLAFKVWRLQPLLIAVAVAVLGCAAIAALGGLLYMVCHGTRVRVTLDLGKASQGILYTLAALALGALVPFARSWIAKVRPLLNPGSALTQVVLGFLMASVGWFVCRLHLWLFDWIYLRLGRVKR